MNFKKRCLLFLFTLLSVSTFCQFAPLAKDILLADSFNVNNSREKIFIHYNKPMYAVNDTMWLKGYIVFAKNNMAADSSKIVHLEVINQAGAVVKRTSALCATGIFYSNITLGKADFKQGNYLLRAYTNRMRNYGDSLFFEGPFKIIDAGDLQWNLSVQTTGVSKNRFFMNATVAGPWAAQPPFKGFDVIVRSKNNVLFKQHVLTDLKGAIAIDTIFDKEIKLNNLQLEVTGENQFKIVLPVPVNAELKKDLQFLPEGGSFLAGKLQQLGFKAIDVLGKGVPVSGAIVNSKRELVTKFSSIRNGMGIVWLQPQLNEQYTAVLSDGLSFKLPTPQQSGTQLQIINQPGGDSIVVVVDASADLYNRNYFFRASAKGISCAMGGIRLVDEPLRLHISKKAFPSGICRFTLYDDHFLPLNERIILIWQHDNLALKLTAQKPFYGNRDSVRILLSARNFSDSAVTGSFSVAVIDTSLLQYPMYTENIISYLTLSSDLKGPIEDAAYYFGNPAAGAAEALMLTQGWVHYDYSGMKPAFAYENAFSISGRASNILYKPKANAKITLFGKDGRANAFYSATTTDEKGNFIFNNFPLFNTDSANLLFKYLNDKGDSWGVGLDLNVPVYPATHAALQTSLLENNMTDSSTTHYVQQHLQLNNRFKKEKGFLQEVVVTRKAKIPGSKNLNENGEYDEAITEKTLDSMPKKNILDVLYKQVRGFRKGVTGNLGNETFLVQTNLAVFVIDGYNIYTEFLNQHAGLREDLNLPSKYNAQTRPKYTILTEYLESILKSITAEDVAGIEILHTAKNKGSYEQYYELHDDYNWQYTFIEITTHSGNGPFNNRSSGMWLYKPTVPVVAKTFYSPHYNNTSSDNSLPDFRSAIYWTPDLVTNEKGEAAFSFYTSDNIGDYLVIVQGTDLNGGLGATYFPLHVKATEKKPGN